MAKLFKSGHWFFHNASRQPEADQLVEAVVASLAGVVDTVSFDTYKVVVGVHLVQRIMSMDLIATVGAAVEQALKCPLRFVSLVPHQLTLAVMHPAFEEEMSGDALRWLATVPFQDWLAQLRLPSSATCTISQGAGPSTAGIA